MGNYKKNIYNNFLKIQHDKMRVYLNYIYLIIKANNYSITNFRKLTFLHIEILFAHP